MEPLSPYRQSTAMRLVVLFTLFFFFLLIAGGIGAAIGLIPGISLRTSFLLSSVVQCIVAFCVPAWFTARFSTTHPWKFLCVAKNPGWKPFAGVVIVYCLALPAMNQIIAWNESLHFPAFAAELEDTLRELEEANGSVADKMMDMHTIWEFLATLAVVGLLTGFSEEMFFRGGLQNIFVDGHARKWIAVWGTALIFSAMHFQFFGFVPRFLMGAFFGYLLVWSGSLWPAIFAHMLNNSIVVITMWMSGGKVDNGIDSFGVAVGNAFPMAAVGSCIATALFLWGFRNYFFKTKR